MFFTEKERQIIKALLEEELNYTLNCGNIQDEVISSYSGSLASILMKMNEDAFKIPKNRCFDFVRGNLASRQLV
ncbi:MAG TPA: hypothetical protein PLV52_00555 [Candidatus Omnitrophota bacterium]|nr:hypothetical protein [Candidatus Omnitrophota bacterium]